jgi:hypothetical protein
MMCNNPIGNPGYMGCQQLLQSNILQTPHMEVNPVRQSVSQVLLSGTQSTSACASKVTSDSASTSKTTSDEQESNTMTTLTFVTSEVDPSTGSNISNEHNASLLSTIAGNLPF